MMTLDLDPPYVHDDRCPICGWPMTWEDCGECDEGAVSFHEEDPLSYGPDETEPCPTCGGRGGWPVCPNAHNHPKDATP